MNAKRLRSFAGATLIAAVLAISVALMVLPGCATLQGVGAKLFGPPTTQPVTSNDVLADFQKDYRIVVDTLTDLRVAGAIKEKQWATILKYEEQIDAGYLRARAIAAEGGDVLSVQSVLSAYAASVNTLKAAKDNPTAPVPDPATQPAPGSL